MSKHSYYSLEHLPFPVFRISSEGSICECNRAAEQLSGYNGVQLLHNNIQMLFQATSSKAFFLQFLATKQDVCQTSQYHAVLINKGGSKRHCTLKIASLDDGYLLFINQQDVEISATGLASDNARKILDGLEEPYWMWDLEQDKIYYSAQFMVLLGYDAQPFTGPRSFWQQHAEKEVLDNVYQQVQRHLQGELSNIHLACKITTRTGQEKWVDIQGKVLEYQNDNAYLMFGMVRDISELKTSIKGLKKQNDFLNMAEHISQSGHWRLDLHNDHLYWSAGVYHIFGVDVLSFKPTVAQALAFFSTEDGDYIRTQLDLAAAKAQGFYVKTTLIQRLGEQIKVEIIAEVESNQQGVVTGIFGVIRDITRDEQQLEQLKLLALVNRTINVPIFFIDERDNIVHQELTHKRSGKTSVLFNYINFSITEYLEFKKLAKQQGQVVKRNISFDNFISVFDLSVTFEQDEAIYIWIVENVTDKFKKEQQQIISNRLALLGNTFGNVSHDINNVLGVALGSVEMLEMKLAQGDQNIQKYVERVKNAIDKGKTVTERLLAFTRKPTVEIALFDPIQDIEDNRYLFEQLLLSTINLSVEYRDCHCQIRFPKGEFINILLNIVLNAQDAIQDVGLSGQIAISAEINTDKKLEIHVKDSGSGIKDSDLTRIFDPFYSSKSVNKGNGIGLANVYDTMYKHNGEVRVQGHCELGGAHFTLVFPCLMQPSSVEESVPDANNGSIGGKSVLVLDDEISIGEFVSLYLKRAGATAICVSSKTQLLEVLEQHPPLDVFITDMILPDLSGREAVNLVLAQYPDIKIYSISGYIAVEESSWDYPVLRKPFNSTELEAFLNN